MDIPYLSPKKKSIHVSPIACQNLDVPQLHDGNYGPTIYYLKETSHLNGKNYTFYIYHILAKCRHTLMFKKLWFPVKEIKN